MVYKQRNTKRKYKGKKKAFRKVRHNKISSELIMYKAPKQSPFPPRFRTVLTTSITGAILAADAVSSGRYFVSMNGPQLPWASGNWPHVLTSAIATLNPAGYSSLLNANLYLSGRCYGSSISVEFIPQALTDTIEATVTPSTNTTNPASVDVAMNMPFTKQSFQSSSKMNMKSGNAINNFVTVHKFLGVSRKAVEDDLSGQLNFLVNADPTRQFYWVINWAAPDAVNVSSVIEYRVKVRYYIECFNLVPTLLQT